MKDHIPKPHLSSEDIDKVIEVLEEIGFHATVSGVFIRGSQKVSFARGGFDYVDGKLKRHYSKIDSLIERLRGNGIKS